MLKQNPAMHLTAPYLNADRSPRPAPRWARLGAIAAGLLLAGLFVTARAHERISFNADWLFSTEDVPSSKEVLSYPRIKPWLLPTANKFRNAADAPAVRPEGNPPGAEHIRCLRPDFDDSQWRKLDLPHDWGIEREFDIDLPGQTGKLPWWGLGWYRKHFKLPATAAGQKIFFDVDGAMAYSSVWVNGQLAGGWPFGYASFRVDITPYVKVGGDNVLVVRLDNPPDSSRWYPGGGMFRNVWLVTSSPYHVAQWGVRVVTPRVEADRAEVYVETTLENETAKSTDLEVTTDLYLLDASGRRTGAAVAHAGPTKTIFPLEPYRAGSVAQAISLASPRRWSLESPDRYVAVTTVTRKGEVVDQLETPFGIRTIAFDPDAGFLLNGVKTKIQGVCLHHDHGSLGAGFNWRAAERQLEILRGMGCNAVRTSHNPPVPEFLELCDRMGFIVMDEAFDAWRLGKKSNDYSLIFPDWHEADLRALVRRDGNRPSVVLWSIGNEIWELRHADGWQLANHLAGIVREEDRTRYVTVGINNTSAPNAGFQLAVDVVGMNYHPGDYKQLHELHPHVPMFGSETASCVSSRGEYFFPVEKEKTKGRSDFQVSSYDLYGPPWAGPPDDTFRGLDETPSMAGEFVWTGFDYFGEPTPYDADRTNLLNFSNPADTAKMEKELLALGRIRSPARSAYFGIIDLAGFPKDRYYLYQARWRPDLPMAHLMPHWNWPERIGEVTPVQVYTSGDEAELFLNGKSLGRKKRGPFEYRFVWEDVKYEPGELKAVTWKNGKPWAEDVRRTTGPAAKLQLSADRATFRADGLDLSYVTVTVADANGLMAPRAKNLIRFEVTGPAEIAGVDNGDPTSFASFRAPQREAFNGLALVILRGQRGASGPVVLKATSEGLAAAEIALRTE